MATLRDILEGIVQSSGPPERDRPGKREKKPDFIKPEGNNGRLQENEELQPTARVRKLGERSPDRSTMHQWLDKMTFSRPVFREGEDMGLIDVLRQLLNFAGDAQLNFGNAVEGKNFESPAYGGGQGDYEFGSRPGTKKLYDQAARYNDELDARSEGPANRERRTGRPARTPSWE